ncbi:nuclear transport factor 2 family protein [Kutzneria sp. 744]|uniref:nuclear transport factor 2 family protein n=1 Tax=Kutzneria sp. (strain 744) TaxID=345341 RepID=UPI0003EEB452|nr:nuclear transport factor 2 family protein [Kutzneria sp. 744]EWM16174.1 CbbQ/NirQ/NorQ/GpvN family protein [Kutzneria sp. 744]
MDRAFAEKFAAEWADAWNAHDLDRLLSHFADDVVWSSPVVVTFNGEESGTLHGKAAVRDYYATGLRRIPDLRFEVLSVRVGMAVMVINYRNQDGREVSEVLVLRDGLVVEGHGTYA